MKLTSLFDYKSKTQAFQIITICTIAVSGYLLYQKDIEMTGVMKYAMDNMKIIDNTGNIYTVKTILKDEARLLEVKDHVSDFYYLVYQFDKNDYESNMEKAEHLAGNVFKKEIIDQHESKGLKSILFGESIRFYGDITSVDVKLVEKGVYIGTIIGTQTSVRYLSLVNGIQELKSSRHLDISFSVLDISKDKEGNNIHGLEINEWEVINWDKIEENEN